MIHYGHINIFCKRNKSTRFAHSRPSDPGVQSTGAGIQVCENEIALNKIQDNVRGLHKHFNCFYTYPHRPIYVLNK